jgi:hypothetical protein
MRKRRYEILLPVKFNDGQPVSGELLEQTREELMTQFRAVQIQPHTVLGLWVYEGNRFEDELRRFTIDVEDTPENRRKISNSSWISSNDCSSDSSKLRSTSYRIRWISCSWPSRCLRWRTGDHLAARVRQGPRGGDAEFVGLREPR